MYSWWCRCCAAKEQLRYARKLASRVSKLERETEAARRLCRRLPSPAETVDAPLGAPGEGVPIKPGRIRTFEDIMALPEGEGSEVPEGLELDVVYDDYITVYRDQIVLPLPPSVARRFCGRGGLRLGAWVEGSNLIIDRQAPATPKRGAKRRRAA
jgi:hypothetical protein